VTGTNAWGIDERYEDGLKRWHQVSDETKQALLRAMGANESRGPEESALLIMAQGADRELPGRSEIELEDGTRLDRNITSRELPLGYHKLSNLDSGHETRLIVAPNKCYLRKRFRAWGWTIQLYALRSQSSWGIGDLEDLRQLAVWSADILSAGVVMTNPFGAAAPSLPQEPSPYYPSSRLFRNPLYLRVEEVPGVREALPDLEQYAAHGRALNEHPLIDRNAIYKLKLDALAKIWSKTRGQVNFESYEREQGRNLSLFASYCVLAERLGADWHQWPQQYQDAESSELTSFVQDFEDRARFHKWIQWLLNSQLLRASERRLIMQDLPIGVDPGGADTWIWQDVFAKGIRVGAPPDPFSETGQDWGLPPFIPHKLRAAGYDPFIQTIRSCMRYSAGLRIDHVMGLFRLFWIPSGESPQNGTYVRYNADEMLAILALESARAQAFVVGEDLGTVEPGVREKLAQFGVLSYRVLWFEDKPPSKYPELSLASVSTHDLPTVAGIWSGADLEEQKQVGMKTNEENHKQYREQLQKIASAEESSCLSEVIVKAHEALAQARSRIVLASLDDALAVEKRPNLPGTNENQRPNWSLALPKNLEEIETDPGVLKIAGILQQSVTKRRSPRKRVRPSP
jgi:4-alpha-glucanotransferase